MLSPHEIAKAHERIAPFTNRTPLLTSSYIDNWLGAKFCFKFEGFQKIGAFKLRGALNVLLKLKEQNKLPERVVAFSSGNHAQAVAYAGKLLGVKTKIFIPEFSSKVKIQATKSYGAEVVLTKTRQEAEAAVVAEAEKGAVFIPPYDSDDLLCGQGTSCYEALQDMNNEPDAIFATVGGGGWISGTYLAARLLAPNAKVYGAEPELANDAAQSYRKGEIVKLTDTPKTIADGARTLAVSERTFEYIRQLADIIEVSEEEIIFATQWLSNLLKITVEPTSAAAFAGAKKLVENGELKGKNILIMLSGGNIDADTYRKIWEKDYLLNQ
jgi:threonine dehydratase